MLNYAKYDTINSKYLCVNHPGNSLIITIREFIDNCIEQQDNDQLEISELMSLKFSKGLNCQLRNKFDNIEFQSYLTTYVIRYN